MANPYNIYHICYLQTNKSTACMDVGTISCLLHVSVDIFNSYGTRVTPYYQQMDTIRCYQHIRPDYFHHFSYRHYIMDYWNTSLCYFYSNIVLVNWLLYDSF